MKSDGFTLFASSSDTISYRHKVLIFKITTSIKNIFHARITLFYNLMPAWISNHIYYKMWNGISSTFLHINSCTIEVWEGISKFIRFTRHVNIPMLGLKSNHIGRRGPWALKRALHLHEIPAEFQRSDLAPTNGTDFAGIVLALTACFCVPDDITESAVIYVI